MSARDVWDGRPVIFAEFSIREGRAVTEAFDESGERGSYMMLVLSLRWAETNEPVFADIDTIEALPYRLRNTLVRLSAKAAALNGLGGGTEDDPDVLPARPNGHAEGAGPSS